MFKKAMNAHPGGPAKPLQSNLLRANTVVPSNPPPPQSAGVKRKIERTNSGVSALASLHNSFYVTENDFDDDIDLDSDESQALNVSKVVDLPNHAIPDSVVYPSLDGTSSKTGQLARTSSTNSNKQAPDVNYPELPLQSQEQAAPSSSIQYPWSSSPPSHFQPPRKPRTLPWLNEDNQESKRDMKTSTVTPPPKRSKATEPWNKSASAIKADQKALRREHKKYPKTDAISKPQSRPKVPALFLSDEQRAVLEAVVDHQKSIFFTGSAGTGKSVLMREIIAKLRNKFHREPDRVAVTASTGLAACNIEGVTLHSFAGIGLGKEDVPLLVKKVSSKFGAKERINSDDHRSRETRKHGIAGCAPRSWSSMKCPWLMGTSLINWKRLLGAFETMDARLVASSLLSRVISSSCLLYRMEAAVRPSLHSQPPPGILPSSTRFS